MKRIQTLVSESPPALAVHSSRAGAQRAPNHSLKSLTPVHQNRCLKVLAPLRASSTQSPSRPLQVTAASSCLSLCLGLPVMVLSSFSSCNPHILLSVSLLSWHPHLSFCFHFCCLLCWLIFLFSESLSDFPLLLLLTFSCLSDPSPRPPVSSVPWNRTGMFPAGSGEGPRHWDARDLGWAIAGLHGQLCPSGWKRLLLRTLLGRGGIAPPEGPSGCLWGAAPSRLLSHRLT